MLFAHPLKELFSGKAEPDKDLKDLFFHIYQLESQVLARENKAPASEQNRTLQKTVETVNKVPPALNRKAEFLTARLRLNMVSFEIYREKVALFLAAEAFETIIKEHPNHIPAYNLYSHFLLRHERPYEAEVVFIRLYDRLHQQGKTLTPQNLVSMADMYRQMGLSKIESEVACLQEASKRILQSLDVDQNERETQKAEAWQYVICERLKTISEAQDILEIDLNKDYWPALEKHLQEEATFLERGQQAAQPPTPPTGA